MKYTKPEGNKDMRLKPKGTGYQVTRDDDSWFIEEHEEGNPQLHGEQLVYGMRNNLYQPVLTSTLEQDKLQAVRRQMLIHGVPIGCEIEVEVTSDSALHNVNDRVKKFRYISALSNKRIRAFLREQALTNGWDSFRYKPMMHRKDDPSLTNPSSEFILAPTTPDFARKTGALHVFNDTNPEYRWVGHNSPNAGGHMHMPMGIFSSQQLVIYYKLIEFWGDARFAPGKDGEADKARRLIQMIGQRKLGRWATWVRLESVESYYEKIVTDNRRTINTSRNFFVQKTRHNTMEHRFPKGSYAADRWIMRMSFLNALYEWSYIIEQESYNDPTKFMLIYDINAFIAHVISQRTKWPELVTYIRNNFTPINMVTSKDRQVTVAEDMWAYADLFLNGIEPNHSVPQERGPRATNQTSGY